MPFIAHKDNTTVIPEAVNDGVSVKCPTCGDEMRARGIQTMSTGRKRYVRLTYRYGNLDGSSSEVGETALTAALSEGETGTVDVSDGTRLPSSGTMLVGDGEYVYVSEVDEANDTIIIESRGVRRTTDTDHAAGERVHYCPMHIRSAVAAKAAVELLAQDDKTDFLVDFGDNLERNEKIRQLEQEWEDIVNAHSDAVV